jgi:DNA-3-methyladenine glycosylase II
MNDLCTTDDINRALAQADPVLGGLIARLGAIRIPLSEDYFASLASAIVGQQLSGRVADVIWDRLKTLLGGSVTPESLLAASDAEMRAVGMSNAKVRYVKALSEAVTDGALQLDALDALDDDTVVRELTAVKGIGRWTAEIFLIFSLGRPDIYSCGDGGLQRAFQWLYGMEPTRENLLRVSGVWQPYRTYASLYLWEAINRKLV